MKPLIDVSYWQDPANINYQELAKHISGVIIRVGYTTTGTHTQKIDPHFETHYAKFKEYGVPVGAYYYSCATNLSVAEAEAEARLLSLKENASSTRFGTTWKRINNELCLSLF